MFLFILSLPVSFASAKQIRTIESGNIEVTFFDSKDQGSVSYNYNLQDWPQPAMEAIMEAARIVDNSLVLNRKMSLAFIWSADPDRNSNIAEAFSNYMNIEDIAGLEHLDSRYKYPRELVHQLAHTTYYGGFNIIMAFNSRKDWCCSSKQAPLSHQQDLITVALHEIAHGLGISSSFTKSTEKQPYIYDKYIVNNNGVSIGNSYSTLRSNTQSQLTNGDLYYTGSKAVKANGGSPVKLHAPSTFCSASLCHFDRIYTNDQEGRLLIPGTSYGVSTRFFGMLAMGIFEDIGWKVKAVSRSDNAVGNVEMELADVKVGSSTGLIHITNPTAEKLQVAIYSLSGAFVTNQTITSNESFTVSANSLYIVKINNRTFKVRA